MSPSASHIRLKPENIFIDSQLYRGVRVATQFQSSISIMIGKRTHAQTQTQTIRSQQISQLNTIALETRLRLWILSMLSRPNIQVKRPKPNQWQWFKRGLERCCCSAVINVDVAWAKRKTDVQIHKDISYAVLRTLSYVLIAPSPQK